MNSKIQTFSDHQAAADLEMYLAAVLRRAYPDPLRRPRLGAAAHPLHRFIPAEINHGRWIVNCPEPGCRGASLADPARPIFMCPSCWNATHGHYWLQVEFPTEREAIEAELLARPLAANRNWVPGESVEQLRRDNAAHGHAAERKG